MTRHCAIVATGQTDFRSRRLDVSIPQNILPELQTLADLTREVERLFES